MQENKNINRQEQVRDYYQGTEEALRKSQEEPCPYEIQLGGHTFVVHLGVFSPRYFDDTEFLGRCLSIAPNEVFLEVGTGTGVIGILAALQGAERVLATDITDAAIQNARENVRRFDLESKIEVRKSDVYSAISEEEKFDTIFWNVPWGYVEHEVSGLDRSVHDPYYESVRRFILEGRQHLRRGGKMLVGFSTTLGRKDLLEMFASQAGFRMDIACERPATDENPVSIELFELK